MFDRFDYDAYGAILGPVRARNHNCLFRDADQGALPDRYLLLRHDVDLDPGAALRLAQWEAAQGLRATYFFLLRSSWYNLLSPRWEDVPRRIVALGHDVGLHYDLPASVAATARDVEEILRSEADVLSVLAGRQVRAISRHNPPPGRAALAWSSPFIDAYADAFTRDATYLSDSGGAWRDGAVEILRGREVPARLQFLTHPIFWGAVHADRAQRVAALTNDRRRALDALQASAISAWASHAGVLEHDKRGAAPASRQP